MATTKKTQKVLAPMIDERETFVSLQKNFADSEVSVQEKLNVLYQLQQADNAIEELVQLRGSLPAEVSVLEDEVGALKAKAAHLEELIAGYSERIELEKKQIVEIDADIAKYQQQLNNISNSREYDSINKELENQGLLRQIAEKNIGDAHAAIDARRADIEALAEKTAIREQDLEAKREELAGIVESTAKEEAELMEKRNELAARIDERTLSAYNRIKNSVYNHLAVVTVCNENSCGGCFNTITPQRLIDIASGKMLVICEHCGRIIVSDRA